MSLMANLGWPSGQVEIRVNTPFVQDCAVIAETAVGRWAAPQFAPQPLLISLGEQMIDGTPEEQCFSCAWSRVASSACRPGLHPVALDKPPLQRGPADAAVEHPPPRAEVGLAVGGRHAAPAPDVWAFVGGVAVVLAGALVPMGGGIGRCEMLEPLLVVLVQP